MAISTEVGGLVLELVGLKVVAFHAVDDDLGEE
jgi:hypothetical protein